jgi:endonuclease-3
MYACLHLYIILFLGREITVKIERGNHLLILDSRLLKILEKKYGSFLETIWPEEYTFEDQFKRLIITVLSQNTSNANTIRAYRGLADEFDITPEVLASADTERLKKAIRSGGLYNIKAKRLKEISKVVLEKFDGDIESVLILPKEKAKTKLMELPGVGDKTADVLLTGIHSYQKILPIDTHFNRVAKRLGISKANDNYNKVQRAYMKFLPEAYREQASGLLWLLGKKTCRAQNPKCTECPLNRICEYSSKS